jgi:hypothetical protein
MRSEEKHSIYSENRKKVYEAIVQHPLLISLVKSAIPYVCLLDMQNVFRHCPLKDFYKIHDQYKSDSEALFRHRQEYLHREGLSSTKIMKNVLDYYRDKQYPHEYADLRYIMSEKQSYNALWILVTQKNMTKENESIVDVDVSSSFSRYYHPNQAIYPMDTMNPNQAMYPMDTMDDTMNNPSTDSPPIVLVSVGCVFTCKETRKWSNCSQHPLLKNEMDDYALLLLATMFLDSSLSIMTSIPYLGPLGTLEQDLKKKKYYRKKKSQKIVLFSNDNFTKSEMIAKLQHYPSKVAFLKYFGP